MKLWRLKALGWVSGIAGYACILWGVWQWSPPFAVIVCGCVCCGLSLTVLEALDGKRNRERATGSDGAMSGVGD